MADPNEKQKFTYHRNSSKSAPALPRDQKPKTAEREGRINTWLQDDSLSRITYISIGGVKDGKPEKGSPARL
ncbi:hypothetical protein MCOR27_000182 [Pyricularia oryzae]|uniref:Uncharacterized protein n=1 Tax=Pyricularia oryzae TaxID=318829 RepID=A0A4P7NG35_PYROR|nr:hypothetical protein MCOR02_008691 [Pyricularia oryzae]KAI6261298.1 hypothetical protein MCOR19_002466 [Pyricularia oryzae]KAI6289435.1 hypothetical protein MCOR27_000182 [Pyricularia oryzae]KAI6335330.1 hypothetical protein MCOR29_000484 [Pyricularia oryzae]KAI6345413.1 hypothetical protein MCOR28_003617 [Pyricularia oryzae]